MSKVYFGDTATGTLVFLVPVTMALSLACGLPSHQCSK